MAARILEGEPMLLPETPVMQVMIDSCKEHGDRIYLDDAKTKKQATFSQILKNAGSISSTIRRLGQGPGKVVIILSDVTVEVLTTNFGIWMSGAALSCINPNLPTEEILFFLKTCKSEVIFCGEPYLKKVKEIVSGVDWNVTIISPNCQDEALDYYSCLDDELSAKGLVLEGWWTGKDHALSIMFTSGTTGSPKGVIVRDRALLYNVHMNAHWRDHTVILMTTPMYWISNTLMSIITSCRGSKVVIASRMPVKQLMETITEYKPTDWLTGPPILIDMCQEEEIDKYDFSSFKAISVTGSVLLIEQRKIFIQKFLGNRQVIRNLYGTTETGLIILDDVILDIDSPKISCLGRAGKGVSIKIMDTETGKIQPPYAIGEICIKSEGVLKQYINKAITEDELDKDGFWHLGDLGYYDDEGYVFYSSRLKDIMKYRGQQIAPAELENVIQKHPDVIECCVVGKMCHEQGGDLPAAFVVKTPGSSLSAEELDNYVCENVINEKKLRGGIFFVDSLPKSPVGKVLRQELQKLLV